LAVLILFFSEVGGKHLVQKMLTVVNNSQSSSHPAGSAWKQPQPLCIDGNRNNAKMGISEKNSYKYHRLALDNFDKNPDQGRRSNFRTF